MSFTVCQSQPKERATSFTLLAWRPTCSVAHRAAREVSTWRGPAMRSSSSVQVPTEHVSSGQAHRRLCHTRREVRSNSGRSTNTTRERPFARAMTPQLGHPVRDRAVSTWMRASPSAPSSPPRKVIAGRPIIQASARGRVSHHGGPPSQVVEQPQIGGPPLRGSRIQLLHPAYFRSTGLMTVASGHRWVMKSVVMNEMGEPVTPPSLLAKTVAHVLIGLLVTAVAKAIFRQKLAVAIVAALLAFAVHQNFDAPVARKLSDLGL